MMERKIEQTNIRGCAAPLDNEVKPTVDDTFAPDWAASTAPSGRYAAAGRTSRMHTKPIAPAAAISAGIGQ